MSIILDKDLAYAICTVVTTGFIENETTKKGKYKTRFIYEEENDKKAHNKIKNYLHDLDIDVQFDKQESKVKHPLIIALTKTMPKDTEELVQDTQVYRALAEEVHEKITRGKLYGAYIGGCIKPDNSIIFSGSSGLKLYERPEKNKKWKIVIENSIVKESFDNAKKSTDEINSYLEDRFSPYSNKVPKYFYCKEIASVTPDKFTENKLFGSIHGLVRVIMEYNLNENGIGTAKDETCCELALSEGTNKVGSCIPCSIFASSNKTPANYTHLGRGDNWNFPDKLKLQPSECLEDKKEKWERYVRGCFDSGYAKLQNKIKNPPAANGLAEVKNLNDKELGEIFLHSLVFEGKFIDKMTYTLFQPDDKYFCGGSIALLILRNVLNRHHPSCHPEFISGSRGSLVPAVHVRGCWL